MCKYMKYIRLFTILTLWLSHLLINFLFFWFTTFPFILLSIKIFLHPGFFSPPLSWLRIQDCWNVLKIKINFKNQRIYLQITSVRVFEMRNYSFGVLNLTKYSVHGVRRLFLFFFSCLVEISYQLRFNQFCDTCPFLLNESMWPFSTTIPRDWAHNC